MENFPEIGGLESGVKIQDLLSSDEFLSRRPKEPRTPDRDAKAAERLRNCPAGSSSATLQELVQLAVELCDADSAGISLEEANEKGELQFRWIAVAGSFERYLNGTTPRFYSPCGTCIDRGSAQHYQVFNPYYNFLGVSAEPILDGLLIPWRSEHSQGTFWLVSHQSEVAFDRNDYEFLRTLVSSASKDLSSRSSVDESGAANLN